MDENYDIFSYPDNDDDDDDDRVYEPILDQVLEPNLPPIPPRNPRLPPVPTKLKPVTEPSFPSVPPKAFNLPQRNARLPPVPTLSSTSQLPWRSQSPLPDVTQRAPAPLPDEIGQYPQSDYEILNIDDDISDMPQHQQLDYEELNVCEPKGPPPPIPEPKGPPPPIPEQKGPPPIPEQKTLPLPIPEMDNNFISAARRNLKKTNTQLATERTQFQFRSELPAQPKILPVKPALPKKPQLQTKPVNCTFAKEKSPALAEKISALTLDKTDRRPIQTPAKLSSHNSFKKTNPIQTPAKLSPHNSFKKTNPIQTPVKLSPHNSFKKTKPQVYKPSVQVEDVSEDDFEISEYADAADINSLHIQPYYYETLDKTLENKIFNEYTEDGIFVIRKSRKENNTHPYTMLVFYESRPYRLKIRYEGDSYAIGEKKIDEVLFPTVMQMIKHYMQTPLALIGAGSTKLKMLPDDF